MTRADKSLAIWGAAGHARVLAEFAPTLGYTIVALFDNDPATKSPLESVPLYHGEEGFDRWRESASPNTEFAFAIGGARGEERLKIMKHVEGAGFGVATLVHPRAFVASSALLASGCQVLANACVGAQAVLDAACIVNTGAIVDHECQLGEGVHIAPGAVLCGCVRVGRCAFIGAGAVVTPRLTIGSGATVAAGAVVIKNVAAQVTVGGVPASLIDAHAPKAQP